MTAPFSRIIPLLAICLVISSLLVGYKTTLFTHEGPCSVLDDPQKILRPPNVQVVVVTAPAHGQYWERFYQNSIGWHTQFPDLRAFTFDEVSQSSQIQNVVRQMGTLPSEKSAKHSNLILAALQEIYTMNSDSDWFFLVEDDTVVVKENLDRLVSTLSSQRKHETPVYYGKCVLYNSTDYGMIDFVVGGAGMLMSRSLLQELAPQIDLCRRQYDSIYYGDARVGACILFTLKRKELRHFDICEPDGFAFTNGSPWREVWHHEGSQLIVTLHEKDPARLRELNEAVLGLSRQRTTVTWDSLKPYLANTSATTEAA
jgi:hypothetical protein